MAVGAHEGTRSSGDISPAAAFHSGPNDLMLKQ